MITTGENRTTWRQPCPRATMSATNPTWTDLGAIQETQFDHVHLAVILLILSHSTELSQLFKYLPHIWKRFTRGSV